jgi:hypothetical protein
LKYRGADGAHVVLIKPDRMHSPGRKPDPPVN